MIPEFSGSDNNVIVAIAMSAKGELQRPIKKHCLLPFV